MPCWATPMKRSPPGARLAELLPISADALDGPLIATNLAAIYAQLGRTRPGAETLENAAAQTAGPTPGTLRWSRNGIRCGTMPRFEKLLG